MLIRRRRKTWPGIVAHHAKFSKPMSDWSSFNVTFLRDKVCSIADKHFWIFSWGSLASNAKQSSSIPARLNVWQGPAVFSCATGTPSSLQRSRKRANCDLQRESDWSITKKSSNMWMILCTPSLCRTIYSNEELNASKMRQEEEQPTSKQRSTYHFPFDWNPSRW